MASLEPHLPRYRLPSPLHPPLEAARHDSHLDPALHALQPPNRPPVHPPPPCRPPRRPRRPHRRPGRRSHRGPRERPLQQRHLLDRVRRLDLAQRRHPVRHAGLAVRAVLLFAAHATAAPADGGRGAVLPVRVARAGDGVGCRGAGDAGAGPVRGGDGRAVWAWAGGGDGWAGEGWGRC